MTENKKSPSSSNQGVTKNPANKRRRRRRRPNKPQGNNKTALSDQKGNSQNPATPLSKKKPNRSNKRRPQNNRKKPLKDHEVPEKYDNLMGLHLLARKKYFENFHKKDKKHVEKLERVFHRTAMDVRAFERKLNPAQKEILENKVNGYSLDLEYSVTNPNSDDVIHTEIPSPPYLDPHISDSQKERESFSHDTEATQGTMDDYEAYKAEKSA